MKLKLNIELEVPDDFAEYPPIELRQLVFDEYINYNNVNHLCDVIKWMSDNDSPSATSVIEHHQLWAKIAQSARFTIELNNNDAVPESG